MGAVAGVGSTYNYIPNVYHAIFESMKKNEVETARAWQMKSIRTVEVIINMVAAYVGGKSYHETYRS